MRHYLSQVKTVFNGNLKSSVASKFMKDNSYLILPQADNSYYCIKRGTQLFANVLYDQGQITLIFYQEGRIHWP